MILLMGIYGGTNVVDIRITPEELVEIFGPSIPMQAAMILFDGADPGGPDVTRAKLREIAVDMNWKLRCRLNELIRVALDQDLDGWDGNLETLEETMALRDAILKDFPASS